MEKERNYLFINGFILKILGAIFMTMDHIGIYMELYENLEKIAMIFRIFGRLALPIFIFLIAEGVRHTSNIKRYFLRLGILGLTFLVGQLGYYYLIERVAGFHSPITDLLIVALALYLLKRKDKYSFLALLPIAYSILCFVVTNVEYAKVTELTWLPFYLRLSYPLYSLLLGIAFFYAKPLSILILKSSESTEALTETSYQRYAESILCALFVLFITLIFQITYKYLNVTYLFQDIQVYACLAFIPLLFYSGKRGYNKPWFKYAAYIYVPMHLIIIYAVFALI